MLPTQLVVFVLAMATFVASGCGSSSSTVATTSRLSETTPSQRTTAPQSTTAALSNEQTSSARGKPLRRAVWIAKGDAICASANSKLSSTTARTQQDFARLLPQAAAYERIEAAELRKLVPPKSKRGDWTQIVASLEKFSEFSAKAGEYARVHNFKAATPVAVSGDTIQRQMTALAKQDGFKVCSVP